MRYSVSMAIPSGAAATPGVGGGRASRARAIAGLAVGAALLLGGPGPLRAEDEAAATARQRLVVVDGDATVRRAPDRAFLTVAVESRDKDPREAQKQAASAMAAVQKKLAVGGLPADAVRTLSYDLTLEADYVNGRRVPRGYVARNSIEVRLDEVTKTGETIDQVIGAGATDVTSVRFDLKDRAEIEREALRLAVADAKSRAEAAAAGAGLAVDEIRRIEQSGGAYEPRPIMMRDMAVAASAGAPPPPETPINAGEIEVRAQVRLTASLH